ncbi:MAG: zinc ribbon domain-containing protein [Nitrososphaerales archaeon]|jgi:hypothetical protein
MSEGKAIGQELSLVDVISKSFEYFRRDFVKYVILFAVVEVIFGVITTLLRHSITAGSLTTTSATGVVGLAPGALGTLFELGGLLFIVGVILLPIIQGTAIKMASDAISSGQTSLGAATRYSASRIVWYWVVGIIVGIIVLLGLIALVVPGIILAIMFFLAFPVVIIERQGLGSLGRSRELVSHRWLKTFALFLVLFIIVVIGSVIAGIIGGPFGEASSIVSGILSAFYLPLLPIAETVYYYSNLARISPPPPATLFGGVPPPATLGAPAGQPERFFCPNCGSEVAARSVFCPNCGAKQPV